MSGHGLSDANLLDAARRETGLSDFGDPSFREPLERLVAALNTEARLNVAGYAYFAERIRNILITRLRAEDWFRRYPEILEEEIHAPLVIVGLPRTGTTMMHRTISADHRMYSPLWYEVRFPVPLPGTDFAAGTDPRIAIAEAEVNALARGITGTRIDPSDGRTRAGRGDHAARAVLLLDGARVSCAYARIRSVARAAGPVARLHLPEAPAAVPAVAEEAARPRGRALGAEGTAPHPFSRGAVRDLPRREGAADAPRPAAADAVLRQHDPRAERIRFRMPPTRRRSRALVRKWATGCGHAALSRCRATTTASSTCGTRTP
jgi:hypothetical protein